MEIDPKRMKRAAADLIWSASALRQVIATCTSAVASTASSSSAVRRARSEGVAGSVRAIRRTCRTRVDER